LLAKHKREVVPQQTIVVQISIKRRLAPLPTFPVVVSEQKVIL